MGAGRGYLGHIVCLGGHGREAEGGRCPGRISVVG
jgi:hypothetical protein